MLWGIELTFCMAWYITFMQPLVEPCRRKKTYIYMFHEIHLFHLSGYFTSEERFQCGCGAALVQVLLMEWFCRHGNVLLLKHLVWTLVMKNLALGQYLSFMWYYSGALSVCVYIYKHIQMFRNSKHQLTYNVWIIVLFIFRRFRSSSTCVLFPTFVNPVFTSHLGRYNTIT